MNPHRCEIGVRSRDGFWRPCGRAAHFYAFFEDLAADLYYRKSSDGGVTWGVPVLVRTGTLVTVPLADGYVGWQRTDVGVYCPQHARAAVAEHNASHRRVLRFEHDELLHRQIVAGCPQCGPV